MNFLVTGTDTNIGKTIVSCLLAHKFNMPYWKPIQTGAREGTDSQFIKKMLSSSKIYEEAYRLDLPSAPHLAATMEGKTISLPYIIKRCPQEDVIIEGAGGLLVPINKSKLMINLIAQLYQKKETMVILVSSSRLGTINHTLMSLKILSDYGISRKGVVLIRDKNSKSNLKDSLEKDSKKHSKKHSKKYLTKHSENIFEDIPKNISEVDLLYQSAKEAIETFGQTQILAELPYLPKITSVQLKQIAQKFIKQPLTL